MLGNGYAFLSFIRQLNNMKSNNKWKTAKGAADDDDVNANAAAADGDVDNDVNADVAEVDDEI